MTYQPNPDDPYRNGLSDDEVRRQARLNRLDNELQADPELAEGPASSGRMAMYAVAVAVVLGAVFYGLNHSSVNEASTTPAAQTAQTQPANPAAPAGMRDVTPRAGGEKANSEPGVTTGAAPANPAAPVKPAINQSANPPADNAPANK